MIKKVTVEVREEHFRKAASLRGSDVSRCEWCLVAQAARDAVGAPVEVGPNLLYFRGEIEGQLLPFEARSLIRAFDMDSDVCDAEILAQLPVSFEVEYEVSP